MHTTDYIKENPEKAETPINSKNLTTAIQVCKHREAFTAECIARKLEPVPAFVYVGYQDTAQYQYVGNADNPFDKSAGFSIDCSDNEYLIDTLSFFVLATKGNLLSLFKAIGVQTMGDINDHDFMKDLHDDQFNILYKFGQTIKAMIEQGLIVVNKRASKPKKSQDINLISGMEVNSIKPSKAKAKPKPKAKPKANLKALSKADLIALLQSS